MPPASGPLGKYIPVEIDMDDLLNEVMGEASEHADKLIKDSAGKKGLGAAVDRTQLNAIRSEMRKQSEETWGKVGGTIAKKMPDAAVAAAEFGLEEDRAILKASGLDKIPQYRNSVLYTATDNVPTLLARGANGIPLSESVYGTKNIADGMVDKVINRNILLGRSAKDMADDVRDLIDPDVKGGVSYAAKRLGRTELNNAFHTTQVKRLEEPWVVAVLWNLSGSHPKPDECNEYAESVHYTGGVPGAYRQGEVPGKPHPNCLCYMTTIANDEDDFMDSFMNGDYDTFIDERIARLAATGRT